jgi:hypothetical protein
MVELGVRRAEFSGTDSLAMNAVTHAEHFLSTERPRLLIAEGDRLSITRWFDYAEEEGYTLWPFYLDAPPAVLADRRMERSLLGDGQDRSWVQGRETKAANLAGTIGAYRLDGSKPPAQIVMDMLRVATPFKDSYKGAVG